MSTPSGERHFTLLVPGLLGLAGFPPAEALEALHVRSIETLFARGLPVEERWADDSPEGMVFQCFGFGARPAGGWPVAAVTRALHDGATPGQWHCRIDPVHLRAGLDSVVLFDAASFSLSEAEARRLAGEINAHFTDPLLRIEPLAAARWYLRRPTALRVRTDPLSLVVGRDLGMHLPAGDDARWWQQRANEIQMLLHGSAVNADREARGELPVNGVWLWGGGTLPGLPESDWAGVWSDESVGRGLARLSQVHWASVPDSATELLQAAEAPGRHLVVLDAGHQLCRRADVEGWRRWLTGLETAWLSPLAAALGQGEIAALEIRTGRRQGVRITGPRTRAWWRRPQRYPRLLARHGQ